jgi:uncharacterized damage-inducible protein DinB
MASSPKQTFLENYDEENATTLRVLRAFPKDKSDFRPTSMNKTARELAWVFVLERGLGTHAWTDAFAKQAPSGKPPEPPKTIEEVIAAFEKSSKEWRQLIASTSDADLSQKIHFFTGPKQMGEYSRLEFAWFLLHDEIHHRGQFSVYVRAAGGKVPSIYGPTADEPWI